MSRITRTCLGVGCSIIFCILARWKKWVIEKKTQIYAGREIYLDVAGINVMVEAALIIEKKTFDEMFRFVVKAMKEGVSENEIWATLEVMSSKQLQSDIAESLKELHEGKVMRFRSAKEALEWLKS